MKSIIKLLNKNKKIRLVIILLFLLMISSFLTIKSYTNRNHIIENNKVNNKRFALYKQKDDESGYDEITSGGFPEGYDLNMELSSCKDRNNTQVAVTNVLSVNGNKVTVTSNKTIYCTLYFDKSTDIKININRGSMTAPTGEYAQYMNGYKGAVSCDNSGSATWNNKYNRLEFSALTNSTTNCNLTYSTDSNSYPLLRDVVESQDNRVEFGNEGVVDEGTVATRDWNNTTLITNLSPTYFRNTTPVSTDQTETGSFWTYDTSTGVFTSDPSTMTISGNYYHAYTQVAESGNYRICYKIAQSSSTNNVLYIAIGTYFKTYISSSTSAAKEECYNLGSLAASDYINISEMASSGVSLPVITFTLEKAGTKTVDAGYRYEGQNPNNYVWFNNESWRIIGSIPTCTNADCSTSENLVKIIRKDSIGDIAYDAKSSGYTGEWGANTLYTLLNTYYYGNTANAKTDATETNYCRGYQNGYRTKCDYSVIGMKNTDYYGSMVKNIYWNTGTANSAESATVTYSTELERQMQGYIGLMSASDYGYASSATTRGALTDYKNATISLNNWLYANNYQWMNIQCLTNAEAVNGVYASGSISGQSASLGLAVRPVVYLDSSVKVVGGAGSESNPYILTK